MRIYLINPPTRTGVVFMKEIGRCGRRSVAGELWPQTGMAYLASVLKDKGHQVYLEDAMAKRMNFTAAVSSVKEFRPDLIVVHTVTPTHNSDLEFCRETKKAMSSVPIALVGTHAAALGNVSIQADYVDTAVCDEGEIPLMLLADRFEKSVKDRSTCIGDILVDIPGFWAKHKDGTIFSSGPGQLVEDLDSLPLPAREYLPNDLYRMPFFVGEPFATVIPSRGCPWACTFCRSGLTWGDKVRTRSVSNVLDELAEVKSRFGIRNIIFMTDTFTYRKEWVIDLCEGMLKKNLGLRWICNSRVDTVDPERLKIMAEAGCLMVAYGVESGDPEILRRCGKEITPEQSIEAVRMTKEAGLSAFAYFIVGLPGETWETIHRTVDFALRADPDHAFFHVATPFPGTQLYETAKKNGWLTTDDWDLYEEDGGGVMRTEALSPEDLRNAQKTAIRKFYLRPSRIWKEIRSVKGMRDLLTKASAAVNLLKSR